MNLVQSIFVLEKTGYEDSYAFFLTGPSDMSEGSFKILCDSLINEAANLALKKESSKDSPCFVGWLQIVESLVPLLESHGFFQFEPKKCTYFGSDIIHNELSDKNNLSEESFKECKDYNTHMFDFTP